ncbi:unnamed protein product, partial [Allacma fusca]
AKNLK